MFVFLKSVPSRLHICSLKRKETKSIWHNERIKGLGWLLSVQYLVEKRTVFLGVCGDEQPLQSDPWVLEWEEKSDYVWVGVCVSILYICMYIYISFNFPATWTYSHQGLRTEG